MNWTDVCLRLVNSFPSFNSLFFQHIAKDVIHGYFDSSALGSRFELKGGLPCSLLGKKSTQSSKTDPMAVDVVSDFWSK